MSRQEKRQELKKQKRKQQRRQAALELSGLQQEVDEEAVIREEEEALAKERAEHEEQERLWLLREEEAQKEWLRKQEEAEADRKRKEEERRLEGEEELEGGWEYVEDGPAEIIWQGNEIIVKKPRKKVRKGTHSSTLLAIEEKRKEGPFSNPLPPQSAAFSSYQADIPDVADQSTNFGTEKDPRNCPFYIKTGVCRFGVRCSRLHPLFNNACTLLMRSMYTGAGLALEPVESLEYTDEEVVQEYEEFYDDVHSEFIQFGEIVNFKVCRNSSPHLRGNVYVHYASQESAMAAYNHMNGRFYAKKQISCEFVGVYKWKLAICGEFMRTYYKTCSHGTACNFLHCFENPRREYEWADTDRPPPRYWQRKMAKLFGHAHVSDEEVDEERSRSRRESTHDTERGRHRDDHDDDRRRDRHSHQRRGRDDRDRKYELNDRTRRGSSKYDDRRRRSSRKREREVDHDDVIGGEKSARHDEPGCINDDRWIAGNDHLETDEHRDRRHGSNDDDDGRYSPTPDRVNHHRSPRHRSRRRSRSPSSHRARRSKTSHRARSQDSEEQDKRDGKETRHRKEKASKESKRHRRSVDDMASQRRRGDAVAGESEHHQRSTPISLESEDMRSGDLEGKVARVVSGENAASTKLETPSGGLKAARVDVENLVQEPKSSTEETGLALDLPADDVQRSTSGWQSWRKSKKKVKLGLKEKPMRVII